jgi:hypothetical protein
MFFAGVRVYEISGFIFSSLCRFGTGSVLRLNPNDFTVSHRETLFPHSNMGWFPVISNGVVTHFSFAGDCFMRDVQELGRATPDEAIAKYSAYRFNKIVSANNPGDEQYASAARHFISG